MFDARQRTKLTAFTISLAIFSLILLAIMVANAKRRSTTVAKPLIARNDGIIPVPQQNDAAPEMHRKAGQPANTPEVYEAYIDNVASADLRYLNKPIAIHGKIRSITKYGLHEYCVRVSYCRDKDWNLYGGLSCIFTKEQAKEISDLNEGDEVNIVGTLMFGQVGRHPHVQRLSTVDLVANKCSVHGR